MSAVSDDNNDKVRYIEEILTKYNIKSSKAIVTTNLDVPNKTGSFIPVICIRSDITIPLDDKECVSLVDGGGFEIGATITISAGHNAIILDPIRALKDNIYYLVLKMKNFKFKLYGGHLYVPDSKFSFIIGDGPLPQKVKDEFEAHIHGKSTESSSSQKLNSSSITSKTFLVAKPFASLTLRLHVQTIRSRGEDDVSATEVVYNTTFSNVENLESLKSKIADMLSISETDTVSLSLLDEFGQVVKIGDDGAVMALTDRATLLVSIVTDDSLNFQEEVSLDQKIEKKMTQAKEKGNFIELDL